MSKSNGSPALAKVKTRPMARGDDTEHSCTPIRRGPDFCRLPVDVPRSVKKVHSTLSPGERGEPDVLSTVAMPPSDTVKTATAGAG